MGKGSLESPQQHPPHKEAPTTDSPPPEGNWSHYLPWGAIPRLLEFNSLANSLLTKLLAQCGRKTGAGLAFSRALQKGRSNEMQRLWLSQHRAVLGLNPNKQPPRCRSTDRHHGDAYNPCSGFFNALGFPPTPNWCLGAHPEQVSQIFMGQTTFAKRQVHPPKCHPAFGRYSMY